VGTKDQGNGLLEIHHQLVELRHQETDLKAELHKIVEKRGALEQILRSAPAPHARRSPARPALRTKAKPGRKAKAPRGRGGAPAAVLGLLQSHRGTPVVIKDIKQQLPAVPPASVHQALSVLKKRGQARSTAPGKWAAAA
jgi:hypothetical protein